MGALCIAVSVLFLLADLVTIPQQRPFQDDESAVLSVSAAYVHGQPLYPDLNAAADYSVLYGPATFLIFAVPAALHAQNLMWFQAWVATGLAIMLGLAFLALRQISRPLAAATALGYYALVIALKAANEWSNKGDPWLLLFVAVGFWAAVRLRSWQADALVAVAGAVLIDIKVTLLPLALLPLLLVSQRERQSLLRRIPAVAIMSVVSLLPFLLPGISLSGYKVELDLAARHGLSTNLLVVNIAFFVRCFALPFAAVLWMLYVSDAKSARQFLQSRRSFLALLLVASAVVVVTGAKNGAGAWHVMPLALPYAFLVAEMLERIPRLSSASLAKQLAPAVWIFGSLGMHGIQRIAESIHSRLHNDDVRPREYNYAAVSKDMLQVAADHPHDTLQVGVSGGGEYNATWLRQLYILRGQPLIFDPNTRAERDASHVPFSPAALRALAECRISLWLIPHGDAPFSMAGGYASASSGTANLLTDPQLYPEPFPTIFAASYHFIGSSNFFDLYLCNARHSRN